MDKGIEPRVFEVGPNATPRDLVAAITAVVDVGGADAVVCGAQGHAAQTQILLESRGVTLGQDLDLASFAGVAHLESGNPLISAVDLEPRGYGKAATELLDLIISDPPATPVHQWFDGANVRLAR